MEQIAHKSLPFLYYLAMQYRSVAVVLGLTVFSWLSDYIQLHCLNVQYGVIYCFDQISPCWKIWEICGCCKSSILPSVLIFSALVFQLETASFSTRGQSIAHCKLNTTLNIPVSINSSKISKRKQTPSPLCGSWLNHRPLLTRSITNCEVHKSRCCTYLSIARKSVVE